MTTRAFDANGHNFGDTVEVEVLEFENGMTSVMTHVGRCQYCAGRAAPVLDAGVIRATTTCSLPDGLTTVVEVDFPSGKVLVTDDLRPIYDVDDEGLEDYGSALGQSQYIKAMAEVGCAYGPVLNTCPSLYRTGDDTFVVASAEYDEATDTVVDFGGVELAKVVTDLWAYSLADYEDWKARGGDPKGLGWTHTVVDVTPGRYRFTCHSGERGFKPHGPGLVVFAHVERVP